MDTNVPRTAEGCPYLPPEIHLMISGFLEDHGRWDTLAVLCRSSNRLRSIYEPRLYSTTEHANNPYCLYPNNLVKALMWGITNESVPVMAQAKAYGADINARVKGCDGKNSFYGWGTMLQHAVQRGRDRSVVWLIQEGAVIKTHAQAAVGMCDCTGRDGGPKHECSTLHLALCKGHLGIAKLIMDHLGPAALKESQRIDWCLILQTAMHMANAKREIEFLSAMLEYPSVRDLVNVVNPHNRQTVLEEGLLRSANSGRNFLRTIIETLVHQGGASLDPYPAGSRHAGQSPLLHVLSHGGYVTARHLLRLGCDPDGKPSTIPVDQNGWRTPLHCLIHHEGAYRGGEEPLWMYDEAGYGLRRRTVRVRKLIKALLRSGASLMIKAADSDSTPLENAISHGAPFLSLSHRVAGYKLLRLLLKNVKEGKITEAAREEAEKCMERIKEDLRAEHALYDLSDERVIEDNEDHEDDGDDGRDQPIRLGWKSCLVSWSEWGPVGEEP